MGVVINPESELGKELAKWEKPYRYEPFPKMVYKAVKRDDGRIVVGDPYDESVGRRCQRTVNNEAELERAREEGWRGSPQEALDHAEGLEREIARAAAERHHSDQRLSEKARDEARTADDATAEHVADIAAPKKGPRGTKVPIS